MNNPSINQDFQKAELRKSENANGANIFQRPLSPNARRLPHDSRSARFVRVTQPMERGRLRAASLRW